MGNLKPGATYIYEKADGITYAREFGAEPSERRIIGWDSRTSDGRSLHDHIMEDKMWGEMRRMAKTNPALQHALDQCIIIYNLSKDHGT